MKKSLSLILAIAMVFSMFASVAFAAEASMDAQAKFDALKAKGIFEGYEDGSAGLDREMTRAEFAAVIVRLMGLPLDSGSASYNDTANHWAHTQGYIEAVTKAGYMEGMGGGVFDPDGKVTVEQLATIMARVLKLEVDANATVEGNVSDWAKGYVAAAVKAGVLANQADFTVNAKRDILVSATYVAEEKVAQASKFSITEAKATGVQTVTVTFSKAAASDATVQLKKGTVAVAATATFAGDRKSATLKLTDVKISEGTYTVSVTSGSDTVSADFTAQNETVSKIEFISADDTVAYSNNATIKAKAVNQYGETVSIGTSNFTALVAGQAPKSFKKDDDGNFVIIADIRGLAGITQGNGMVPVTVYMNNSNVTASKIFKVGTVPILSKIEVGNITYSNNKTNLSAAGDTASIALKMYDQYGNVLVRSQFDTAEIAKSQINPVILPYEENLEIVKLGDTTLDLFDENDNARIKVRLKAKVDKTADYTVNIYGGTSSATASVKVGASNLATKVEFDASNVIIGATDTEVYVPLIVTDANGNKLSAQDIVDNKARLSFTVSVAGATAAVQETGEKKGQLKLTFPANSLTVNSRVYISGQIVQSQTNTFVQTSIPVTDARIPERIAVTTEPAAKAILGADDKVVFQLKDQYGKDLKNIPVTITNANGQTSQYRIKVEVTREGNGVDATPRGVGIVAEPGATVTKTTYIFANDKFEEFNKGFDLTTNGQEGKVTVKAVVQKKDQGAADFSDYSTAVSRSLESIKPDTKLTYSIKPLGTLFAAKDKLGTDAGDPKASLYDKKVEVVAKDEAGNTVKLPLNYVRGISSSDPQVLLVDRDTAGGVEDGYVLGNKAGEATVSAVVYTNKGELINLTDKVTVKADPIVVDKIEAGNTTATYDAAKTFAYEYFTKDADNQLKVTDQYGVTYKNADIAAAKKALGILYTVKTTSGTGTVTMNTDTGEITSVPATVTEFQITAIAPNGKSVSVLVTKP